MELKNKSQESVSAHPPQVAGPKVVVGNQESKKNARFFPAQKDP